MHINVRIISSYFLLFAALAFMACNVGYAAESPQVIPVQNAGFEDGLTVWHVGPEFKDQVSIESTTVHSGAKALKIDATAKNNTPFVTYSAKVTGGSAYEFSVWARVAPGSPAVQGALKMESYSATANTAGKYATLKLPEDGTWKQITLQLQMPADTIRCAFLLRVFGKGAVIFDDVSLMKVSDAPDISIIAPTEMSLKPGEESPVSYQLSLRQAWAGPGLPKIVAHLQSLQDATKVLSVPTVVKQTEDNQHYSASFTVPKLESRDYAVKFEYQQNGETLHTEFPAYIFTTITQRQPKSLTDDGTLLWNGKPFFPIGMYHPGGEDSYKALAENGFNAVQGAAVLDLDQFKASLDLAQKYGLAVDVPLYNGMQVKKNLANSLAKVKQFKNHPAILDWKIFDEPHISMEGGPAVGIPEAYRVLKAADSNHPFELTLNSAATQKFWSDYCDIVQPDGYPLPRFPLTEVSDLARNAKSVMKPWQNLSFVVQSGWVADLSNQPSVAQARSMVYLAMIEGAKGIWWYSMHDPGWDLTKTPLWPHMKAINAEVKVLSQPLMLGKVLNGISCDQPKVLFRAIEYQNKTYLLVTNPESAAVQVTFTLPNNLQSYHLMNSDVKGDLKNHTMTLSLQGVDSRTYILEK